MAQLWSDPDIVHWWLPNDEGLPDIVRAVREWTSERAPPPGGQNGKSEDVKDMKSIFSKITMGGEGQFEEDSERQ